ncbi:FAD-dependent oxidoreductase [Aurantivibrio infirmus]
MKKLLILLVFIVGIAMFFVLGFDDYFTFDNLKASQEKFSDLFEQSPWLIASTFFIVYVLMAAFSIPAASLLTLAAGALFGLVLGTVLVSFASSIGSTCAFLVSRYVLGNSMQEKYGNRLKAINEGIEREGAFYLFTLRLVPIFPFFVINILMGLTKIKATTFYWVSQLGMFAATVVYVNAGTQLGQLESVGDILSFNLIASFVLLGFFPLIAKRIIDFVKKRRVYAKWTRPKSYDRNLIVIGAGAAGLVSALIAATVKAKVTLVEAHKMGGDCLNYGCVPSKALIKSAKLVNQMRNGEKYGIDSAEAKFSFKQVMRRVDDIIKTIEPHDSVERYTGLGVDVVQGYAKIVDPWTVEITCEDGGVRKLTSRNIIIAAGAQPFVPPLPGIDEVGYVTSDTLWDKFSELEQPPKRLVVLGGGPIGCELAQSFARLGSQVTQIEMLPRIMIREDEEVAALAEESLRADGINVLTDHKALRCEKEGEKKILVVEHQGQESRIEFDELLCAVGRSARLSGYGLEELGIETQRTVVTNDYLETLYPNIYAAGDVAGPYQFTHTASHQAWYASVNALFGQFKRFKADYSVIPWTTFIDPEVARVGLNEQEAKEKDIPYEVSTYPLDDLDRAIADSTTAGFVKVLTPPGKDKILGVTIVGAHAGDLLAEYVLAMKHGLGLNKILGTIHTYPTLAEANKFAAGVWKQANKPEKLLGYAKRYHDWMRK